MVPISRTCDVENSSDFIRYYQNGWVGWHPTDSAHIQPAIVLGSGGILDGEQSISLRYLSKNSKGGFDLGETEHVPWPKVTEHIDFGVPDIGMHEEGPTIVFCSHNSPRAAKKGYRPAELSISEFNAWHIRKKYTTRMYRDRGYDWVWSAFNPEYVSLSKALEMLKEGESVGVPISRTIGLYTTPNYQYPLLAYKRWTVGHVPDAYLICLQPQYEDYGFEIQRQTGTKVMVG